MCHKRIETKEIIAPEREVALLFPGSEAISGQDVIFTHLELHFVCFLCVCVILCSCSFLSIFNSLRKTVKVLERFPNTVGGSQE